MPKEQHHNHEIEKKAVYQLGSKIIDCGWIFRNQTESDFGIDAELEKCITSPDGKKYVVGEIVKVQIKGVENVKMVDDESMVPFDLDKDELVYLCNELTATPLLIVGDVTNQKAYWFDVKEQGPAALKDKPENKTYRFKAPLDQEITPQNSSKMYQHLHRAEYLTFRQGLARHLSEGEIATGLLDLSALINTIAPPGHRVFSRPPSSYHAPGTVMSILEGETAVDLVKADSFKPGDEIKVKMQVAFPNDEEGRKAHEEWLEHMKGGTATIDLARKYIKNVKVLAGEKVIANMPSADLFMGPSRSKMGLVLRSKKTGEQLFITGESWAEPNGKLCFDSSAFDVTQAVHLSLSFEFPSGHASLNMSINSANVPTCGDAEYVISLLHSFDQGIEFLVDERGIQKKLAEAPSTPLDFGFSDEGIALIHKLAVIEQNAKVAFPFKKIQEMNKQEVDNAVILFALFSDEIANAPMTLSATGADSAAKSLEGEGISIECPGELQFPILGHRLTWPDGMLVEGICEKIAQTAEEGAGQWQIYIPQARISRLKSEQSTAQ